MLVERGKDTSDTVQTTHAQWEREKHASLIFGVVRALLVLFLSEFTFPETRFRIEEQKNRQVSEKSQIL